MGCTHGHEGACAACGREEFVQGMEDEIEQIRQQLADATQRAERKEADYFAEMEAHTACMKREMEARDRVAELEGLLRERPEPEDVHDCCGSGFMCMGGRQPSKEYKDWSAKVDAAIAPKPGCEGTTGSNAHVRTFKH